ncbi:MAG: DegT/DnrJ/EryC1/StrS family aminotransferase, partial [Dehalococcoidia bacterium]
GMLTTSDADAARRLRSLRVHGLDFDAWQRYSSAGFGGYDVVEPGFKYNMTDLQASLGLHQLARLDANHQIRERHWQAYNRGLGDLPAVEIPTAIPCEARHALHLYTLLLRLDRLRLDRQQFLEALKAENIGAGVHFIPVHEYAYYRRKYGYEAGTFKNAEEIGRSTVSLPLSPMLTDADVNDVIEAVRKIATYYAR